MRDQFMTYSSLDLGSSYLGRGRCPVPTGEFGARQYPGAGPVGGFAGLIVGIL